MGESGKEDAARSQGGPTDTCERSSWLVSALTARRRARSLCNALPSSLASDGQRPRSSRRDECVPLGHPSRPAPPDGHFRPGAPRSPPRELAGFLKRIIPGTATLPLIRLADRATSPFNPMMMYASIFLYAATLVYLVAATVTHHAQSAPSGDRLFFFIQVADPQFGVINGYSSSVQTALDWTAEASLFETAMVQASRLGPDFVVLSGDMQQFYPRNQGGINGILSNFTNEEVGRAQAEDVKEILDRTLGSDPRELPVYTLPGNHDLDDAPDNITLSYYEEFWGPAGGGWHSFVHEDVVFLVLNSQLYFNDTNVPGDLAREQTDWLVSELKQIKDWTRPPRNIVVLTHISPFAASVEESQGWSNWRKEHRLDVLQKAVLSQDLDYWPTLWLCGHFHGNARYYGPVAVNASSNHVEEENVARKIEVVVSNSVTYPMQWDGVLPNETYTSEQWNAIATISSAGEAFDRFIAPDFSRVSGGPDKAGLRVMEFFTNGSYRHKWFSLNEIGTVEQVDDESMKDATHVPAAWNVDNGDGETPRNISKKSKAGKNKKDRKSKSDKGDFF